MSVSVSLRPLRGGREVPSLSARSAPCCFSIPLLRVPFRSKPVNCCTPSPASRSWTVSSSPTKSLIPTPQHGFNAKITFETVRNRYILSILFSNYESNTPDHSARTLSHRPPTIHLKLPVGFCGPVFVLLYRVVRATSSPAESVYSRSLIMSA